MHTHNDNNDNNFINNDNDNVTNSWYSTTEMIIHWHWILCPIPMISAMTQVKVPFGVFGEGRLALPVGRRGEVIPVWVCRRFLFVRYCSLSFVMIRYYLLSFVIICYYSLLFVMFSVVRRCSLFLFNSLFFHYVIHYILLFFLINTFSSPHLCLFTQSRRGLVHDHRLLPRIPGISW